ncbi:MAG: asparagine synthase-related protein [Thermoplasmata archaeon]|nr:asparagine synthase-related protein [Thermoplasmata archaeon]
MASEPVLSPAVEASLAESLRRATLLEGSPAGPLEILYSGGLDSSVLAWILRERPHTSLMTVGLADSPDILAAAAGAQLIGLPWRPVLVDLGGVEAGWERWKHAIGDARDPCASVQLALALALESASASSILLGQGADELFWGYARYRGLTAEAGDRLAVTDLARLIDVDLPRTRTIAGACGREIRLPYLNPEFREQLAGVGSRAHMSRERSKPLLRRLALHLGVAESLREQPKRAMQYGSRVAATLRKVQRDAARPSAAEYPRPMGLIPARRHA